MEKKRKTAVVVIILVLLIASVSAVVYLSIFYKPKCEDKTCFNNALVNCQRVSYLSEEEDATWLYIIEGKSEGSCITNVKLIHLKQGSVGMEILVGKNMDCYTTIGVLTKPQENLEDCHGLLKEEIQSILIKKMHAYITENLGQIAEELNRVI